MQTRFATTNWTQVLAAREAVSPESRQALETLCRTYWYPLYVFVRREVGDVEAARDLTQSYFIELLEKDYLSDFDPARGRFRVFLKTSVKHFLSKQREKARTVRRGGRIDIISLDDRQLEQRFTTEPADAVTPEEIFERRWTLDLLERVLTRLRGEQEEAGLSRQFARLEGFLTGEDADIGYQEVAGELGCSPAAVKTTVHRLRRRFGQLLRAEVAETVENADQVDEEVRYLLGVVAPWGSRARGSR